MSRLLRDRVLAGLAPAELSLVRMSGAWRPRIASAQAVDCDPAFGTRPWHGALGALGQAAAGMGGAAADVTVVLSNHFVRYALVPWSDALDGAEEEIAFARHTFAATHGERVKGWEVRVSAGSRGEARLASAIDRELADALRACFPPGGRARLVSVQPHLLSAFNLWRRGLPRSAWLLIVEAQRACIALRTEGRWASVRNARGGFDDAEAWVELLERERYRIGGDVPDDVAVFAPHNARAAFPGTGRWKFSGLMLPLKEGSPAADPARYALALSAQ